MPHLAWHIAFGQWFFRHRNAMFPVVFIVVGLLARPHVLLGNPLVDCGLRITGVLLALTGEAVRLLTIGLEYIERGGRNKQVYASRLVEGGIYGHTRNPMYLGNLSIAIGMSMATGAPLACLVVIPLFVFVYQTIMAAEEAYLHQRFGAEYVAYCRRVPRLLPSVRGLRKTVSQTGYDWRRAVRKDLSTIAALLLGLICLPVWRAYFLQGSAAARARAPVAAALGLAVGAVYGLLVYLKQRRRLFYLPAELSSRDLQ